MAKNNSRKHKNSIRWQRSMTTSDDQKREFCSVCFFFVFVDVKNKMTAAGRWNENRREWIRRRRHCVLRACREIRMTQLITYLFIYLCMCIYPLEQAIQQNINANDFDTKTRVAKWRRRKLKIMSWRSRFVFLLFFVYSLHWIERTIEKTFKKTSNYNSIDAFSCQFLSVFLFLFSFYQCGDRIRTQEMMKQKKCFPSFGCCCLFWRPSQEFVFRAHSKNKKKIFEFFRIWFTHETFAYFRVIIYRFASWIFRRLLRTFFVWKNIAFLLFDGSWREGPKVWKQ